MTEHISGGYIMLARQILSSTLWTLPVNYRLLAFTCLLKANWKPGEIMPKGKLVLIPRGSFWTSRDSLGRDAGLKPGVVEAGLRALKTIGFLSWRGDCRGRLVTVLNYDFYQNPDHYGTSSGNSEPTASSTASSTANSTAGGTRLRRKEVKEGQEGQEEKEEKEEKEEGVQQTERLYSGCTETEDPLRADTDKSSEHSDVVSTSSEYRHINTAYAENSGNGAEPQKIPSSVNASSCQKRTAASKNTPLRKLIEKGARENATNFPTKQFTRRVEQAYGDEDDNEDEVIPF